mmetsp:Transcript_17677/g.35549  ORF Transcript_17677/g.35549 Transcript_17677/m.35549 type:complete len:224 (-) Transcript_17677:138-809(-)
MSAAIPSPTDSPDVVRMLRASGGCELEPPKSKPGESGPGLVSGSARGERANASSCGSSIIFDGSASSVGSDFATPFPSNNISLPGPENFPDCIPSMRESSQSSCESSNGVRIDTFPAAFAGLLSTIILLRLNCCGPSMRCSSPFPSLSIGVIPIEWHARTKTLTIFDIRCSRTSCRCLLCSISVYMSCFSASFCCRASSKLCCLFFRMWTSCMSLSTSLFVLC